MAVTTRHERPKFALLDLDNTLVRGSSMERWCDVLVHTGGTTPDYVGRNLWKIQRLHEAHAAGHMDHHELVTECGKRYARAMHGNSPFMTEQIAAHWEELSRKCQPPYGGWWFDEDFDPPVIWRAYDWRMPRPMWFADRLTRTLEDVGILGVLITGAPTEVAELYAPHFRAVVGGALKLEVGGKYNCFTGRVVRNAGLREEKERIAAEFAERGDVVLAAGDSFNDVPLFNVADRVLIVGDGISPDESWPRVHRLPVRETGSGRRNLAALQRALGARELAL